MPGKRITVGFLALALLAGCAGSGSRPGEDPCHPAPPQSPGIYVYDDLFLPVYLLYALTCEGIQSLDRHGAFTPAPKGEVHDGIYSPADGTFSVAAPAGLEIREQLSAQRDYVFFAPRFLRGPVYGVSLDVELAPQYASLSLREYAALALKDARLENQRVAGVSLVLLHREDMSLDGRSALFELYSQTPAGADKPAAYYLMYFMKTRSRGVVLSIVWPGDCPRCAAGTEQDVRATDPHIADFVGSFRLADTGRDQ